MQSCSKLPRCFIQGVILNLFVATHERKKGEWMVRGKKAFVGGVLLTISICAVQLQGVGAEGLSSAVNSSAGTEQRKITFVATDVGIFERSTTKKLLSQFSQELARIRKEAERTQTDPVYTEKLKSLALKLFAKHEKHLVASPQDPTIRTIGDASWMRKYPEMFRESHRMAALLAELQDLIPATEQLVDGQNGAKRVALDTCFRTTLQAMVEDVADLYNKSQSNDPSVPSFLPKRDCGVLPTTPVDTHTVEHEAAATENAPECTGCLKSASVAEPTAEDKSKKTGLLKSFVRFVMRKNHPEKLTDAVVDDLKKTQGGEAAEALLGSGEKGAEDDLSADAERGVDSETAVNLNVTRVDTGRSLVERSIGTKLAVSPTKTSYVPVPNVTVDTPTPTPAPLAPINKPQPSLLRRHGPAVFAGAVCGALAAYIVYEYRKRAAQSDQNPESTSSGNIAQASTTAPDVEQSENIFSQTEDFFSNDQDEIAGLSPEEVELQFQALQEARDNESTLHKKAELVEDELRQAE